jgi:hypothetical protein
MIKQETMKPGTWLIISWLHRLLLEPIESVAASVSEWTLREIVNSSLRQT